MTRSRYGIAAALGGLAAAWAGSAAAETAYGTEGATSSFLKLLTERLNSPSSRFPPSAAIWRACPTLSMAAPCSCLLGIVVAGLAAEYIVRLLLSRARLRGFDRLVGHSPLRAFGLAVLLDLVALIALVVASRLVARPDRRSAERRRASFGQQVFQAVLYWRAFNLLFRAWLRPNTPEGRIAPVDDAAARGLLVALNWVIVLPLLGHHIARDAPHHGRQPRGRERRRHPLRAADRGLPALGRSGTGTRRWRRGCRRWCRSARSATG